MSTNAPARGCEICREGATMVLFLTGICGRSCWYCPLSAERKGKDVTFANERPVLSDTDVVDEIRRMDALGTSVTGGEPFLRIDRLISVCRLIKDTFGPGHYIHLYTGIAPGMKSLSALSGLVDEIRLHPPPESWSDLAGSPYLTAVSRARDLGFSAGIEVPALEGVELLARVLDQVDFLNINELEWGESNADEMRRRGFLPKDITQNAIRGSEGWAGRIRHLSKVHWCPSAYKDSVQLRMRLLRIAERTARTFDEITRDGTVVYGVIEPTDTDREYIGKHPEWEIREVGDRFETGWEGLRRHAGSLTGKKYIVERYPDGGMIVEVMPL
jgi:pyruvate formate-lyase activating enzyme-like uncharacterized protein